MIVIALSKLYPIYSFQTSAFYTDEEMELDRQLCALRAKGNRGKKRDDLTKKTRQQRENEKMPPLTKTERKDNNEQIKQTKELLQSALTKNMDLVRTVRPEFMVDKNYCSYHYNRSILCLFIFSYCF